MTKRNPKVSFLISVFNGERYLEDTLESIRNQKYKNFQVVIVNDGSTDSTIKIIYKYKKIFSNFKIINHKTNLGLTASLNTAAKISDGEWLARIDADDICSGSRLEEQLKLAKSNKNVALVGSACKFIDANNNFLFCKKFPKESKNIVSDLQKVKAFFPHSSALIKKSAFFKVGAYDEFYQYSQDYDLWLRLSEKFKIICSEKFLIKCRIHKNRISAGESQKKQFIFARVAIINYWLRNFYKISLNNNSYKKLYQNISKFITKDSFYKGYFCYNKCKEFFAKGAYVKMIITIIKNINILFVFFTKAIYFREYFLKRIAMEILDHNS